MKSKAGKYEGILQEPISTEYLHFYMTELNKNYILSLWSDLTYLFQISEKCEKEEFKRLSKKVVEFYFPKGGRHKVQIKKRLYNDLLYRISCPDIKADAFKDIYEYITLLLQNVYCCGFLTSIRFVLAQSLMRWAEKFKDFPDDIKWVIYDAIEDDLMKERYRTSNSNNTGVYTGCSQILKEKDIENIQKSHKQKNKLLSGVTYRDELRENIYYQPTNYPDGSNKESSCSYRASHYATLSSYVPDQQSLFGYDENVQ